MVRSSSSLLFAVVLFLSLALVVWWTSFLLIASGEITEASEQLANEDLPGAIQALGASSLESLKELGTRRQWMFASEGLFFLIVLSVCGWLYLSSVRREIQLRSNQNRFLAAATHELKTPLATISLLLESLREDRVPPEKHQRYLSNGLLEANRLERGLHNLLTAAGLRSAGTAMRVTPGDLADDVRQSIEAMQARALAADVNLEFQIPETLLADRDMAAMQLVLRNLIDNAIKFSPADSTVHVALSKEQDMAKIVVRDQGRGLSSDEVTHAFDPFYRGDDKASGGTGLGLHLVHEMVHAHSGTVEANSSGRDQGSEFIVNIPMRQKA